MLCEQCNGTFQKADCFKKRKVELSVFDHAFPLGMKCLWKLSGQLVQFGECNSVPLRWDCWNEPDPYSWKVQLL